jgi:hypothetical protein
MIAVRALTAPSFPWSQEYVRCMPERSRRSVPITNFIEEFFGAPLDPEFVTSVPDIKSATIVDLFDAYQQYAKSFSTGTKAAIELAPVNHRFPTFRRSRDPIIADSYLKRAMSQLLYAHRCSFVDSLGYNLAMWSHPRFEYRQALRWDSQPQYRAGLQNYLETLMYLRPLIDARLVDILPSVPDRDGPNIYREISFGAARPSAGFMLALEMLYGAEFASRHARDLRKSGYSMIPVLPGDNGTKLGGLENAFTQLIRKLTPPWIKAGDLSLETPQEMQALRYLLSNGLASGAALSSTRVMAEVETLALPQIESLQPSDVVALHSRTEWADFRLALSHGLERADLNAAKGHEERLRYIAEELETVGRAADRAAKESKLSSQRRKVGRDVVIGVAVASGLTPVTGLTPALLGAAGIGARSVASLTWAWLASRREEGSLRTAINCFTTCARE